LVVFIGFGRPPSLMGPAPRLIIGGAILGLALTLAAVAPVTPSAPTTVPDVPSAVTLSVLSGQDVRVNWQPPLTDGGQAVTTYHVEWDTDPGTQEVQTLTTTAFTEANEVQSITTASLDVDEIQLVTTSATLLYEIQTIRTSASSGGALGGTFAVILDTMSSGGSLQTSGEISHDAAATGNYLSMKNVLEAMKNIGPNGIHDVTRTVDDVATGGWVWSITFSPALGDVPTLKLGDASALTGNGATVTFNDAGLNHRSANLIGGGFRLTFDGYTTELIAHDASAGKLAEALQHLQTIESVDVARSGPDDQGGYQWTVTFTSDLNWGNVNQMVPVTTDLTGSGAIAEVRTLTDGNELDGAFNVSFGRGIGQVVPFDCSAPEMKQALEKVGTGAVAVYRAGPDYELVTCGRSPSSKRRVMLT
jgi:hypothetical protein